MTAEIRKISLLCISVITLLLSPKVSSAATNISFDSITAGDYDKIVEELSANFNYSSVTPASSLGKVWGIEFGAVGGITKTPEILTLVKRADPSTSLKDNFYHGGALVRLGVPLGITLEALAIPKVTKSNISAKQTGGAAQWTITDVFFTELPVTLAIKAYYTQTDLSFSQTINNSTTSNIDVNATIDFTNTIWGIKTKASRKFFVFEPFVGIGYAHGEGTLTVNASGSATIFSPSFSTGKSASSTPTSMQMLAGLDVQLLFLSLGAEYSRAFGKNSFTGRLSFRF